MEDTLRKEFTDKYEKDSIERSKKLKDEAYFKGRKEASDEMTLENLKLREIIDSLRVEVSSKSKKLVEYQF